MIIFSFDAYEPEEISLTVFKSGKGDYKIDLDSKRGLRAWEIGKNHTDIGAIELAIQLWRTELNLMKEEEV